MEYLEALGQVLKEIRVTAGLSREDCSQALSREYLASVEQGRQTISIGKLRSLCECLDIAPSLVLFAAEAREASLKLEEYKANQERQLSAHLKAGSLRDEAEPGSSQGLRSKRAETTRKAVQLLQAEGLTKIQIARSLSIGTTTVDRYWVPVT